MKPPAILKRITLTLACNSFALCFLCESEMCKMHYAEVSKEKISKPEAEGDVESRLRKCILDKALERENQHMGHIFLEGYYSKNCLFFSKFDS